jgi:hypothetical protein
VLKLYCLFLLAPLGIERLHAQKQIQLNDTLLANCNVYEAKMKPQKGSLSLTPFTFSDYTVLDLKNQWKTSSYWSVYMKDKYMTRETKATRTSFSFSFTNSTTDTASVAVLFQKDTPGNLVITSKHVGEPDGQSGEPIEAFTAYIKFNKEEKPWQLVLHRDKNGWIWNRKYRGVLTNGEDTINILTIDHWSDGKKPMIRGLFDLGTEFYSGSESLAAVQYPILKNPKVWLSTKMTDSRRFLIATAVETLLIECSDNTDDNQMFKN